MTVNSSRSAVEIYKKLGFMNLAGEQNFSGMKFTPMKLKCS